MPRPHHDILLQSTESFPEALTPLPPYEYRYLASRSRSGVFSLSADDARPARTPEGLDI